MTTSTDTVPRPLAGRRSHMAAEMAETPAVLQRLLRTRPELLESLRRAPRPLAGIVLVGRGSSEHAALYGRYLLEMATGRPATIFPPSLARTTVPGAYQGFLAVGISQSGETEDVVDALAALRRAGAVTVGLTAQPVSPLAGLADIPVDLCTGPELAVPATKTFVASLAALALVADGLRGGIWSPGDWTRLVGAVAAVLDDPVPPGLAAGRLAPGDTVACVARGVLRPVASEAALKLQEVALLQADGHSTISFHHGPIAAIGPERPMIGFASAGPAGDDTRNLLGRLSVAGGRTILVDQSPAADIPLPAGVRRSLLPLVAAVRAQQLALAVAVRRGLDPDEPPGLTKVTRP